MRKMEFKKLVMISYGGLIASILSIFTTIVSYTNVSGTRKTFSVIDFISSYEFDYFVLGIYR